MSFVWPTSHIGMLHPAGDSRARLRTKDFLSFAESSRQNVSYRDAKQRLSCSQHQAETRKSLFEELGLLFVPYRSDQIMLTPLGEQFADLLMDRDLSHLDGDVARQASALLVWALCRVQINRPQSRGVPRLSEAEWQGCNVKPYAAAWTATRDLDGVLYLHEFMGSIRKLHQVSDYSTIIATVAESRRNNHFLANKKQWEDRGPEMNYTIYWRSHLSLAQQIMEWNPEDQALTANSALWDVVEAALRFQAGCDEDSEDAMKAASWSDPEDYFFNIAGAACPPFLASGKPRLTIFGGEPLADLSSYDVTSAALGRYRIIGGPELCTLPYKQACFHMDSRERLLRLDKKQRLPHGGIQIELGLGRPIADIDVMMRALGGEIA